MSNLLDFYRGQAIDSEGRSLSDILSWPDDDWEAVHDFIQWLFPLPEASQFNSDAPLLTAADIAAFHDDPLLHAKLAESFRRFLAFAGLVIGHDGKVAEADNFAARSLDVWVAPNHNWLRITRVLRSATLLGLEADAHAFFEWLATAFRNGRFPIGAATFAYWRNAAP